MAPERKMSYPEYRKQAKTFDIINCQHHKFPFNYIGHTAMVYVCPATDQVMVYESTQMSFTGISGVQLTPMGLWVSKYDGNIWIRPRELYSGLWMYAEICEAKFMCDRHIKDHRGTSYPDLNKISGKARLVNALIDLPGLNKFENKDRDDIQHCTDNTTDCYKFCGLAKGFSSSEQEPDNLRAKGMVLTGADTFSQYLTKGVTLADYEIKIK